MISITKANKQQTQFILSCLPEQKWNIFFEYIAAKQSQKIIGTIGSLHFLDFCIIDNLFLFEDKKNIQLKIGLIKSALNIIDLRGVHTVFARKLPENEELLKLVGFNNVSISRDIILKLNKVYDKTYDFMMIDLTGYFDNNCSSHK